MNDVVSSQSLEAPPRRSARWLKWAVVVTLCVGGLASVAYHELRTSAIQSWLLSRDAASLSYEIAPGPSPSIAFPRGGPFDAQHGYPRLGDFSRRLASAGYPVAEQARQSAGTIRFVRWGVTPLYREPAKSSAPSNAATINRELELLRRALRLAHDRLLLPTIPKVKTLEEQNTRQGFFKRPDLEAVVAALPAYLQDFTRFAYLTGSRKGEIISLK